MISSYIKTFTKYSIVFFFISFLFVKRLKSSMYNQQYYSIPGVVSYTSMDIGSYSSGTIEYINVKKGSFVKKGDEILKLHNDIIDSRIEGYESNAAIMNEVDYYSLLKKRDHLSIKSPVDGYILNLPVDSGAFVKEMDIVATVIPVDSLEYSIIIPKKQLDTFTTEERQLYTTLNKNVILEIKPQDGSKKTVNAKIVDVSPIIRADDAKSHNTVFLKISILPDSKLDIYNDITSDISVLVEKRTFIKNFMEIISYIKSKLLTYKTVLIK